MESLEGTTHSTGCNWCLLIEDLIHESISIWILHDNFHGFTLLKFKLHHFLLEFGLICSEFLSGIRDDLLSWIFKVFEVILCEDLTLDIICLESLELLGNTRIVEIQLTVLIFDSLENALHLLSCFFHDSFNDDKKSVRSQELRNLCLDINFLSISSVIHHLLDSVHELLDFGVIFEGDFTVELEISFRNIVLS